MNIFSIIIPVYNAEKIITRCLESIARQTFKDFEVVMVNDGSKDRSEEVINEFLAIHSDVDAHLVRQQNAGAGVARNVGISQSKGEYIVFLDSDDYIEDNYLESIYEKIKDEDADVVFIDIIREREGGAVIRHEDMSRFANLGKERLIRWQITGETPWGGCRKAVRSSIIRDNQLEYAPIKVGEESIFSLRILEEAKRIAFQPKAIYHYVETDTSLTAHDEIGNSLGVFNFIYSYLKENGKLEKYSETVRSMAVTTMTIAINVASENQEFGEAMVTSRKLLKEYKQYYTGKTDWDALEWRVKVCLPWIKMGWPLPVLIASKMKRIFTK